MALLLDEIAATVTGAGLTNVSCASPERHHAVNPVAPFDVDAATRVHRGQQGTKTRHHPGKDARLAASKSALNVLRAPKMRRTNNI
jgi:hypothetical protein